MREAAEGKPVQIGRLQRYATDAAMAAKGKQFYTRAEPTGRRIAVVGAGPAGLACRAPAGAMHGHDVIDLRGDGARLAASTNTASPPTRAPDDFAQAEVDYVTAIGGITIEHGERARPRRALSPT